MPTDLRQSHKGLSWHGKAPTPNWENEKETRGHRALYEDENGVCIKDNSSGAGPLAFASKTAKAGGAIIDKS